MSSTATRKFPVEMILLALMMMIAACSSPTPATPDHPPTNPPTNPPQPPPGKAELILGETHIDSFNDNYLSYQIVATIENTGNAEAKGFNAGCTYQCPAGDTYTSGGLDIVQSGSIGPNSSFTYKSPFHYMCTVSTPTIDLICTIEAPDSGTQTYSVTQLHLP
jgi:hypothetical protein